MAGTNDNVIVGVRRDTIPRRLDQILLQKDRLTVSIVHGIRRMTFCACGRPGRREADHKQGVAGTGRQVIVERVRKVAFGAAAS